MVRALLQTSIHPFLHFYVRNYLLCKTPQECLKNSQDPQVNMTFPEVTQQTGFGGAGQRGKTQAVSEETGEVMMGIRKTVACPVKSTRP